RADSRSGGAGAPDSDAARRGGTADQRSRMMTETRQAADRFILFTVAETMYAVHSRDVRHMEMVEQVTRVPNAPPFVDGVVFSRGLVVPVVNLRARFGFARTPYT